MKIFKFTVIGLLLWILFETRAHALPDKKRRKYWAEECYQEDKRKFGQEFAAMSYRRKMEDKASESPWRKLKDFLGIA